MNIVAIGAHPDDIEIGVGASIAIHSARGDNVRFIILTNGGKLSDPDQRVREARTSAEILGVTDVQFLNYEDTMVPYDHEIVDRLEYHLESMDADRVYIHGSRDTHQDHINASQASITASRHVDEVLAFETPSTRSSFTPQYYSTVSKEFLDRKIEAIQSHKSQKEKKYLEAEAMEGLARFRGRQAGSGYAEAFQVIRINNGFAAEV